MDLTQSLRFVRDTVGATLVLAGLYVLTYVSPSSLLRIPGYFLVVGFGLAEMMLAPIDLHPYVPIAVYLLGLGVVSATAAHAFRRFVPGSYRSGLAVALSGALAIVGSLALLVALSVILDTSQREPALISATVGVLMLLISGWLVGLYDVEVTGPIAR